MNKNKLRILLCISVLCSPLGSHAVSPDDLMKSVVEDGKPLAEGSITGPVADMIKQRTHTLKDPYMRIEKVQSAYKDCTQLMQMLTVPNIPSQKGENLGDMVSVTKLTMCPPGKLPKGAATQEIISCKIGKQDCANFDKKM